MKVSVAGTYKHITLGEYCQWHKAYDNDVLKCCAATGLSKELVRELKRDKVDKIIATFERALSQPTSRTEWKIALGGVDYGLIPDLTSHGVTMAEYIDLVNNSQEANKYDTLPKVMAILYRPIVATFGKKYSIEPYDYKKHLANAKIMEGLSMEIVNGTLLFFSTISNELRVNSQLSLVKNLEKTMTEIDNPTHSQSTAGNILWQKLAGVIYSKRKKF